jgi:hypothetical protein
MHVNGDGLAVRSKKEALARHSCQVKLLYRALLGEWAIPTRERAGMTDLAQQSRRLPLSSYFLGMQMLRK